MKKLITIVLILAACGKKVTRSGDSSVVVAPPAPAPVPTVAVVEPPVKCQLWSNQALLPLVTDEVGDYEIGLPALVFPDQPDQDLPFASFIGTPAEVLTKYFSMSCAFTFEAPVSGEYRFSLTADDGAQLYINDLKIIENGGNHAMFTMSSTLILFKGSYSLKLLYLETSGPKGLNLTVKRPGALLPELL